MSRFQNAMMDMMMCMPGMDTICRALFFDTLSGFLRRCFSSSLNDVYGNGKSKGFPFFDLKGGEKFLD